MKDDYILRSAESEEDAEKLEALFTRVFQEEEVGSLARIFFHHLPGLEKRHWFIAQERVSSDLVSAFVLIPWQWEFSGIRLAAAEMGIVGTEEAHRGKGLIKALYSRFDKVLSEEGYDLTVIQGIPGFYHKFGYHYAIPLENHIDLPLHLIPEKTVACRRAGPADIPFLMEEDNCYREKREISVFRDRESWEYLLSRSQETDYGSEYWIMERGGYCNKEYYFRIPLKGFGSGLIISETSENITYEAALALLSFCGKLAEERGKPSIRINLPADSVLGRTALDLGGKQGPCYAWQIRIPDPVRFLSKIASVLERRVTESPFRGYSGTLRLDVYNRKIDLRFVRGEISVLPAESEEEAPEGELLSFCVNPDLLPCLVLGHRTWRELQYIHPDIFPLGTYTDPRNPSRRAGLLMDYLFPRVNSWIHERY